MAGLLPSQMMLYTVRQSNRDIVRRPRELPKMMQVLIMEDEIDQANLLGEIVSRAGHEVAVSYSGIEAFALLQDQHFDAVLTDIYVIEDGHVGPSNGGLFLINKIRAWRREGAPDWVYALKIIAITGALGHASKILELADEFGADLCFQKPVNPKLILDAITRDPDEKIRTKEDYQLLKFTT